MNKIFKKNISVYVISGADPGFGNGGGGGGSKISSKASYIIQAKRVYISWGGGGGALRAPRNKIEFRTPQSESEHNLTNLFVTFLLRIFWKIFFYDYRSKIAQLDLQIHLRYIH